MLALLRRVNNVFCRLCCLVVPEMGSGGWCHFSCARGAMWTGELEPRHGCEYSLKMVTWIWSEDGKGFPHSCPISGAWSNHSDNCCLPCLPHKNYTEANSNLKPKPDQTIFIFSWAIFYSYPLHGFLDETAEGGNDLDCDIKQSNKNISWWCHSDDHNR